MQSVRAILYSIVTINRMVHSNHPWFPMVFPQVITFGLVCPSPGLATVIRQVHAIEIDAKGFYGHDIRIIPQNSAIDLII